ncbi:unnamed protein product [Taenia asiatica]|uniref:Tudor domain-containing protein n=1 Tax=Taenia asiatica TaxID=60517 RepID=A0A0R3VYN4_TAEAS|nr:unnamed protein product [Taenia asiatica]
MLARGDMCVFQRTDDASHEFGVVEVVDTDSDLVLIATPDSNTDRCRVKISRVMKLETAKDDIIVQCLDSLNESYIKMQLEAAKLIKDKVDDTISGTGSSNDEGGDLCERMGKESTYNGNQDQVELLRKRMGSSSEWQVGDVCVCRWSGDNKWYFAEIIDIIEEAGYCDVQFLHYCNEQYFIRLDRIHRVDASSWKWVEDEENATAAQKLLNTRGMNSYRRETQTSISVADPEKKSATRLMDPNVGDICVCQWGGDAYFYFAKIVAIDITEGMYKVKLLHRKRGECYVPFENIYPFYSTEANMVTYGRNVRRMRREIAKQMFKMRLHFRRVPMVVSEPSVQSGKPDVKNGKGQGKKGSLGGEWKSSGGPVLSKFWRTLLLETYGNDENSVRNLLNSWYMCGYQTGYAMVRISSDFFRIKISFRSAEY